MAKLSAHGVELFREDLLTKRYAYMSDGVVLVNRGDGWKKHGKVKTGMTPEAAINIIKDRAAEFDHTHPAWIAYRSAVHAVVPLESRWHLCEAVKTLQNDPDGLYAELTDDFSGRFHHVTVNDCIELCKLRAAANDEGRALKLSA